jgi:hypothetical protein
LWTNLHPSFWIGLGIIAVYLIANLVETAFNARLEEPVSGATRSKQLLILLGLCSVCTMVNPFGYKLHTYLIHLAVVWPQQAKLIGESEVYPILVTGGATGFAFELLFALGIVSLAFNRSKVAVCQIVLFILFGHMAFAMVRLVPIFVLINLPFIAEWIATIPKIDHKKVASPVRAFLLRWRKIAGDTTCGDSYQLRRLPIFVVVLLLVIATAQNSTHAFTLIKAGFDSKRLPTSTANFIVDHHFPEKAGFSMYAWGGYLRWVYGIHVFIDDSNQFFDQKAYRTYLQIVNASSGWERVVADHQISWV